MQLGGDVDDNTPHRGTCPWFIALVPGRDVKGSDEGSEGSGGSIPLPTGGPPPGVFDDAGRRKRESEGGILTWESGAPRWSGKCDDGAASLFGAPIFPYGAERDGADGGE